jgi:hypothetical protein
VHQHQVQLLQSKVLQTLLHGRAATQNVTNNNKANVVMPASVLHQHQVQCCIFTSSTLSKTCHPDIAFALLVVGSLSLLTH